MIIRFFAKGLLPILSLQKDMKVVGKAGDGEEACRLYDQLSPDVLILDSGCRKKMASGCDELMYGRRDPGYRADSSEKPEVFGASMTAGV